jgi:hypothetical protein
METYMSRCTDDDPGTTRKQRFPGCLMQSKRGPPRIFGYGGNTCPMIASI